jgi:carbon storage regulator
MLVLTRKLRQSIMIGHDVEVSVLAVSGDKVRLGISAPRSVPVFRKEIYVEIHGEEADQAASQEGSTDGTGPPSGQAADRPQPAAAD